MGPLLQAALSNCLMALVLAVLAACVGRWCRRPAVTHGLWVLVLLKLLTPPLVAVPVPWPQREEPAGTAAEPGLPEAPPEPAPFAAVPKPAAPPEQPEARGEPVEGPAVEVPAVPEAPPADALPPPAPDLPAAPPVRPAPLQDAPAVAADGLPWPVLVGALWLAGAVSWFGLALTRIRAFGRLLRHAALAPAKLQQEAEALAARLGLAHCPRVWLVPGAVSPMLWALGGAARLLLPADLLGRLGPEQRATLLTHELAHLKRRDHWVRVLELLVLGLYWWFPLVWWARRELREAEEECCDAWVVWALPDSARAYATALVETLDFLSGSHLALPPAASGVGPLHLLRRRLTMIMRGTAPRTLTGAGFLALCGLGIVLLPLVPSWAQSPVGGAPKEERPADLDARKADLDKAKADLAHAQIDLQQLQADLAAKQGQLEQRAAQYKQAQENLNRAEKRKPAPETRPNADLRRKAAEALGALQKDAAKRGGTRPGTTTGSPDLQKRLGDVERKLDLLLTEVVSLRQELAKQRRVAPPGGRSNTSPAPRTHPPGERAPNLPGASGRETRPNFTSPTPEVKPAAR